MERVYVLCCLVSIVVCYGIMASTAMAADTKGTIPLLSNLTLDRSFRGHWAMLKVDKNATSNETVTPFGSPEGGFYITKLKQYPAATSVGSNDTSKVSCDLIQAEVVVRDGVYVTDHASNVVVYGIFVPAYRTLLLYSSFLKMDSSRVSHTIDLPAIGDALYATTQVVETTRNASLPASSTPPVSSSPAEKLLMFFDKYVHGQFLTEAAKKKTKNNKNKCPLLIAMKVTIDNTTSPERKSALTPEDIEREIRETQEFGGPISSVVLVGLLNSLGGCSFYAAVIARYIISEMEDRSAVLYIVVAIFMGIFDLLVFRAQQNATARSQSVCSSPVE